MNTLLKTLAVIFAAAMPVIVGADFVGVSLPSIFNLSYAFTGFALVVGSLTISADYRTAKPLAARVASRQPAHSRSVLPLAA